MMGNYFKSIKKGFKLKYYFNYILVLAALIVSVILINGGSMKLSTANLVAQISYSIILAVSLNLVVGCLGELSLGHAGFMCIGAYIGGIVANSLYEKIPSKLVVLIIAALIGGISAAVAGFAIGLPALRLKGDYLAIVTLAFGEIVRNIFKNISIFGGAQGLTTTKHLTRKDMSLVIILLVAVFLMLIFIQNLIRSKHGRAITAIRDNEIAAKAMGINVTFYKIFVFVIAAFFAGIAGTFYSQITTPVLYSFFSYNYSIEILVMVVLGGMGSITGSIISATVITYINFLLTTKLSGDLAALKYLIYALILIFMIIFNNAPALKPIKDKLSFKNLKKLIRKGKSNPAIVKDDEADWTRVTTKVQMDEILSVDLKAKSNESDKREDRK